MRLLSIVLPTIFLFAVSSCQPKTSQSQNTPSSTDSLVVTDTIGEGIALTQIGDMQLYTLLDMASSMDQALFPDLDSSLSNQLIPSGKAPSSISVFLLQRNGKNILFDTGMGFSFKDKLDTLGLSTSDIDAVIISHFHADHISGLMSNDSTTFSKAQLFLPAPEMDAFNNGTAHTMLATFIKNLETAYEGRITLVSADSLVYEGIRAHAAFGHTPGHMVYEVDQFLFAGDLLHAAAIQFSHPEICATYDADKEEAIKSRLFYYNEAATRQMTMAASHLPFPGVIIDFPSVCTSKSE